MKNLVTKYLENELENVENNFDYYDSSYSTQKIIESEKRQIRRLIEVVNKLHKSIKVSKRNH